MGKARTTVGLDVPAVKIVTAVLDVESRELKTFTMDAETGKAAGFCAALPGPVQAGYEAGPTGYGLARDLAKRGVGMVAAPSKIPCGTGPGCRFLRSPPARYRTSSLQRP